MEKQILGSVISYLADTGDWRFIVDQINGTFTVVPNVGTGWEYASGTNHENLANLILQAKADCVASGIDWTGA